MKQPGEAMSIFGQSCSKMQLCEATNQKLQFFGQDFGRTEQQKQQHSLQHQSGARALRARTPLSYPAQGLTWASPGFDPGQPRPAQVNFLVKILVKQNNRTTGPFVVSVPAVVSVALFD